MLGIPLRQLVIVKYLLTESGVFTGNTSDQDLAVLTERYISQYGKGKVSDSAIETEHSRSASCLLYGCLLCFCTPVIGLRALRANNELH